MLNIPLFSKTLAAKWNVNQKIAPAFTDLSFPIKRQDAANGNGDSPVENRPTNGNWCLGQISTSVLGKTQMLNRADVFTYTFTPQTAQQSR